MLELNLDWPLEPSGGVFPNISQGFLLDEDNALRQHLMGLKVSDDQERERPVGVWFSQPDKEIREQKYPYMTITMIDVTESIDRTNTGYYDDFVPAFSVPMEAIPDNAYLGKDRKFYVPSSKYPLEFLTRPPVPVYIDYQVRAFSRHPRHNRTILADFLGKKVPYRYAVLDMGKVDGTARRMQLMDIGQSEATENNKRLFVSSFTVRVDSFMPTPDILVVIRTPVTKIIGTLHGYVRSGRTNYRRYTDGWVLEAPDTTREVSNV